MASAKLFANGVDHCLVVVEEHLAAMPARQTPVAYTFSAWVRELLLRSKGAQTLLMSKLSKCLVSM